MINTRSLCNDVDKNFLYILGYCVIRNRCVRVYGLDNDEIFRAKEYPHIPGYKTEDYLYSRALHDTEVLETRKRINNITEFLKGHGIAEVDHLRFRDKDDTVIEEKCYIRIEFDLLWKSSSLSQTRDMIRKSHDAYKKVAETYLNDDTKKFAYSTIDSRNVVSFYFANK